MVTPEQISRLAPTLTLWATLPIVGALLFGLWGFIGGLLVALAIQAPKSGDK